MMIDDDVGEDEEGGEERGGGGRGRGDDKGSDNAKITQRKSFGKESQTRSKTRKHNSKLTSFVLDEFYALRASLCLC